jgi:hypothetical protein
MRRTQPPAHIDFCALGADWHGGHLTNDGQSVIAADASWLAAALERSLADIADTSPPLDWDPKHWMKDDLPEWLSPQERAIVEDELQEGCLDIIGVDPLDHFAGAEKANLRRFTPGKLQNLMNGNEEPLEKRGSVFAYAVPFDLALV